jgi:hypothetical protein
MSLSQKRRCLTATREARASSGLKHEYLLFIAGALVALLAGPALAQSPEVVREWDFVKGIQDWQPNQTAKVRQAADGIVVTTDGRDPVVIGRVHALEGGGTKSGWQAANRRVGQDLDASVWPFKTKLRHPDRASAMVQRRFLFAFFDPQHPG